MGAATIYLSFLDAGAWALFLLKTIVPGLLLIPIAYISLICLYRIYFHPLSKYPGPILAKVSNLYAGYHAWRGDVHTDILKCHERYGKVIRYSPERLLFNTAESVSDIYSHRSNVLKSKVYHALSAQAPNSLTLRDKALHGKRRRVISQAFSENTLRSFEPKVIEKIHQLSDTIVEVPQETDKSSREWSESKDMGHCFDHLTFDIMTDVLFSARFNTIGDPKYRYAMTAIEESNVRLGVLVQAPELRRKKLQPLLFPQALKARYMFVMFIRKVLGERLKPSKEDRKDVFSFVQQAKDPDTGNSLDITELSTETATLIIAGSDTTSTSMAATLHYLSFSPLAYKKAAEEVRRCFTNLEEIRMGPLLNSCTYLRACIDEGLRMSPPGGGPLWREVYKGGALIDGMHIQEGVDVAVGIHSIHHNPEYFPEPYRYNPDRWLKTINGTEELEKMRSAYMPFGLGPRSCVGKPLALVELMLTMATFLWQFDFRASNRDEVAWADGTMAAEQFHLKDHVTGQKDGPLIEFRLRI